MSAGVRHGSSLRAYVMRTLPDCSPILVSNRAPHEPKPDGGFKRGAGGVITALLSGDGDLAQDVEQELMELRRASFASQDMREGVRAFAEKRAARWRGE